MSNASLKSQIKALVDQIDECDDPVPDPVEPINPPGDNATSSAVGYGATMGGTGGELMQPRNMDEWIQAMEATQRRIIDPVFSSHMDLPRQIVVSSGNVSHIGSVSVGYPFGSSHDGAPIMVHASDVLLRNIRSRPGPASTRTCCRDALSIQTTMSHRVTVDNCSASWATDEGFDSWYGAHDFTVMRCFLAEMLANSPYKEWTAKSTLFGSGLDDAGANVTFYENVMAANLGRNPLIGMDNYEIVNNFIFGQGNWGSQIYNASEQPFHGAWVGNVYIDGPDSAQDPIGNQMHFTGSGIHACYVDDNLHKDRRDGWQAAKSRGAYQELQEWDFTPGVIVRPAEQVVDRLVPMVGAKPRDANDERMMAGVVAESLNYVDCVDGNVPTDLNNNCARNVQFIRP